VGFGKTYLKLTAPRVGLEQEPNSSGKQGFADKRDADSDALLGDPILNDPDVVKILLAWPNLAPEARATILAIVRQMARE
jgi:hypothetical protein